MLRTALVAHQGQTSWAQPKQRSQNPRANRRGRSESRSGVEKRPPGSKADPAAAPRRAAQAP